MNKLSRLYCLLSLILFVSTVFAQYAARDNDPGGLIQNDLYAYYTKNHNAFNFGSAPFYANLSTRETEIIHTEAYAIIKQYQAILNGIAENMGKNEATVTELKNEFIGLFLNRKISVFNDLEPTHSYSKDYEVETYISNLLLWYPDGMEINIVLDQITSPGIKAHNKNIYYVDFRLTKIINGNYQNRSMNNNNEELTFRIAFAKNKKKVKNFKIVGIRDANAMAEEATDNTELQSLNQVDYSEAELAEVQASAKSLILDYARSLELMGNPDESDEYKEYYKVDFLSLFTNENVRVFNDIEPDADADLIGINTYLENYKLNYPKGIINLNLNVDSATFTHIEEADDGTLQTMVYINKFFSGLFEGKEKFTSGNSLIFAFSLEKKDGAFQNLQIKSIDKEYTDFSGIDVIEEAELEFKPIVPITRKGPSVGFTYMGGIGMINSSNINELTIENDSHFWNVKNAYGYWVGLDFYMMRTENFGFSTGIKFAHYETTYGMNTTHLGKQEERFRSDSMYDPNKKLKHIKELFADDFDSTNTISYLCVPINVRYIKDINKNTAIYINSGINLSLLYSSQYKLGGKFDLRGLYSDSDTVGYRYFDNFGFKEDVNYDAMVATGKTNNANISIIGELGFGLIFKTGYYSSLQFGPKIYYGLTSAFKPELYTDVFGNQRQTKPTRTNNFGFEVSYIIKL